MSEPVMKLVKSFFSASPDSWECRAAMFPLYVAMFHYAGTWTATAVIFVSFVCGLTAWVIAKVVTESSQRRRKNTSERGLRL